MIDPLSLALVDDSGVNMGEVGWCLNGRGYRNMGKIVGRMRVEKMKMPGGVDAREEKLSGGRQRDREV